MGYDTTMIALDSMAMTYWIDGMSSAYRPPEDPCHEEKVALTRIYFWMPDQSSFHLTPTVEAEYRLISDQAKLANHESWRSVLISPVRPLPNPALVEKRTSELKRYHSGERDCRIIAESELTEILDLLTFDPRMQKNLGKQARGVNVCTPTEYWRRMAIPRGSIPLRRPHASNPLSQCTWWHWDEASAE